MLAGVFSVAGFGFPNVYEGENQRIERSLLLEENTHDEVPVTDFQFVCGVQEVDRVRPLSRHDRPEWSVQVPDVNLSNNEQPRHS